MVVTQIALIWVPCTELRLQQGRSVYLVFFIRVEISVVDPDPHQIKINFRIRIKIYALDTEPDPHKFAYVKAKCIEY
jgi:hypothetical protein